MNIPKFRAWSIHYRQMFEVTMLRWSAASPNVLDRIEMLSLDGLHQVRTVYGNETIHANYKLTQYIDRQDKHGKPIYADDIIIADWRWTEPHRLVWPDDYYWFQEVSLEGENMEVIGNYWEHPELLRGKQP